MIRIIVKITGVLLEMGTSLNSTAPIPSRGEIKRSIRTFPTDANERW
jgi:hypothetical protein